MPLRLLRLLTCSDGCIVGDHVGFRLIACRSAYCIPSRSSNALSFALLGAVYVITPGTEPYYLIPLRSSNPFTDYMATRCTDGCAVLDSTWLQAFLLHYLEELQRLLTCTERRIAPDFIWLLGHRLPLLRELQRLL